MDEGSPKGWVEVAEGVDDECSSVSRYYPRRMWRPVLERVIDRGCDEVLSSAEVLNSLSTRYILEVLNKDYFFNSVAQEYVCLDKWI